MISMHCQIWNSLYMYLLYACVRCMFCYLSTFVSRWMYNGLLTRVLTFLLYIVHVDTLYGISFAHHYGKHNLLSLFINMQSYWYSLCSPDCLDDIVHVLYNCLMFSVAIFFYIIILYRFTFFSHLKRRGLHFYSIVYQSLIRYWSS